MSAQEVRGRLVGDDRIEMGVVMVEDGTIVGVTVAESPSQSDRDLPFIAPGFVDIHVHGWAGHDAMGGGAALDGMARALLRRGVTSFLPTAVTASIPTLVAFAESVRGWIPSAAADGAQPLGFNLEGPFLAAARRGAHDPTHLIAPADVPLADLAALIDGLRLVTIAPELPGATELIAWLRAMGVAISLGHSAATIEQAQAGYAAGATSTTHLFNAMSGVDHRAPGLAVAALIDDAVYVELIADGTHVTPAIWPIITRTKPSDRLLLVSDAIAQAGMGDGRTLIGGLEVEVAGDRATLAGTTTLAGSVIAVDTAVRHIVRSGVTLPAAIAAASRNPLALMGITDRGRIDVGQHADLVELDDALRVRRVMRAGVWFDGAPV